MTKKLYINVPRMHAMLNRFKEAGQQGFLNSAFAKALIEIYGTNTARILFVRYYKNFHHNGAVPRQDGFAWLIPYNDVTAARLGAYRRDVLGDRWAMHARIENLGGFLSETQHYIGFVTPTHDNVYYPAPDVGGNYTTTMLRTMSHVFDAALDGMEFDVSFHQFYRTRADIIAAINNDPRGYLDPSKFAAQLLGFPRNGFPDYNNPFPQEEVAVVGQI